MEDGDVKPRVQTVVDIWTKVRRKGLRLLEKAAIWNVLEKSMTLRSNVG
jgi:hypothetical protein